jgi:hypothetical protein
VAGNGRKSADETLLIAIACGATVETAATKAGISPRTAHRRLQTPDFQIRLSEIKSGMMVVFFGFFSLLALAAAGDSRTGSSAVFLAVSFCLREFQTTSGHAFDGLTRR